MIDFLGQAWVQVLLVMLLPVMVVFLIWRVLQQGRRPVQPAPSPPPYPQRPAYSHGCPNCGAPVLHDALYCNRCGMPLGSTYIPPDASTPTGQLELPTTPCITCGTANPTGSYYCHYCGKAVDLTKPPPPGAAQLAYCAPPQYIRPNPPASPPLTPGDILGWGFISLFIPFVGLILPIIWLTQKRAGALGCLIAYLCYGGFGVLYLLWGLLHPGTYY